MASLTAMLGSGIKSIQRGVVTTNTASSGTITVSAVNTAKSVLIINGSANWSTQIYTTNYGYWYSSFIGVLTNSTTITWSLPFGTWSSGSLAWQLVEFY